MSSRTWEIKGVARPIALVFVPFAGGYFLSYLYRSITAIIAGELTRDLGLSAADLGLLTSAYLLAFAAFQIPLGLLLDRFGPRRVQACLLFVAAVGAITFSLAESKGALFIGRALIGLGVAGGLMASLKAITQWFPRERWPLVNGCFLAVGGFGAMAATTPVELLLNYTSWRGVFAGLSAATVGVAAAILVLVPERATGTRRPGLADQVRGFRRIYRDRVFWRLAPVSVACMATNLSILGLWIGPWLRDVAGLPGAAVADTLFATAAAMTVGFIAVGMIADLLGRLGVRLTRVMGAGIVFFLLAQVAIVFEADRTRLWPWLMFGLMANFTTLAYAHLSRHFPIEYVGRASTGLNVMVFSGAFAAQYAMGAIIDMWPALPQGGYADGAYQAAFGVFLALEVATFIWFLLAGARRQRAPARE